MRACDHPRMSAGSEGTIIELIADGDPDAAAGFYDARASSVRDYCAELCPPDRVEDATLAAFVDLLGRTMNAAADADAGELLTRSARIAIASRMHSPTCPEIPELIAARLNGEFVHNEEPLYSHLSQCGHCQIVAERLAQAGNALEHVSFTQPPAKARARWLELAAREQPELQESESFEPEPAVGETLPSPQAAPAPFQPAPVRVRARRGGLVGAAKRLARGR
jgi:hypothetical protein